MASASFPLPSKIDDSTFDLAQWGREKWVAAHDGEVQPTLTALLAKVHYVSFDDFFATLRASYKAVEKSLSSRECIVLTEERKSNGWVAQIAREAFGFKAKETFPLGESEARKFCEELDTMELEDIKTLLKDRTIVLFDDGSYSGKQLRKHLEGIICKLISLGIKTQNISLVVPYMTDEAMSQIAEVQDKYKAFSIEVAPHTRIDTLADLGTSECDKLLDLWYPAEASTPKAAGSSDFKAPTSVSHTNSASKSKSRSSATLAKKAPHVEKDIAGSKAKTYSLDERKRLSRSLGLIWYQHKVPNDQSFPIALANGTVYHDGASTAEQYPIVPKILEPYKK